MVKTATIDFSLQGHNFKLSSSRKFISVRAASKEFAMDLRQLRHLIAIVDQRSFSGAAKAVHLTQPALTRSMNALEQSVGDSLLIRKNNGVSPTAAGFILYEYAKMLTAGADNARAEIARLSQGLGGQITIGVGTHMAELMMSPILAKFASKQPNLSINLRTGLIEDLVPMIMEGEVELVASMVPMDRMQKGLVFERLFTTLTAIYAASDHPLSRTGGQIGFDRLVREPWVVLNSDHADVSARRMFSAGGCGFPKQILRTDSISMIRTMIETEGYLGSLPAEYMKGSRTKALDVPGMPLLRSCGLVYRADVPLRPIAVEFADLLRAELSPVNAPLA
ncbi:LysR family transcriptional regulator [Novosphingobium sp. P6W]|uniref:LysR family transcriptional regulator n=1 Tax=Novosphingobium sp. P6W TaxID=1609758 RepID=UPI0013B407EE|nr:LysR family transcriptional regulator [Novosphingobium sp. P6W]